MLTPRPPHSEAPRFTIASAVYNVERYLGEFVASIERQTIDLERVEVIVVDDGSTDGSLALLEEWRNRRPELVTVLSKANGGQGSARNLALDHARGEWTTFLDPDDWMNDEYLEIVDRFIAAHPDVDLVATNRIFYEESGRGIRDGHPLRKMFRTDQLVNLEAFPEYFHGSAPAAFVRTDRVNADRLRFDDRIQPNFEDGHFCARYLLASDTPMVGFLKSAEYYYRKRGDGSSTLQNSVQQSGRFVEVPKHGYLDALQRGSAAHGRAPTWLQNMVLYELSWYFSSEDQPSNAASAAVGEVADRFLSTLARIVEYLDDEVIRGFDVRPYKQVWRDVLLRGVRGETWHTNYAVMQQYDQVRRQVRIALRWTGERPEVTFLARGRELAPPHSKVRTYVFFDRAMVHETIAWVPATAALRVRVNDRPVGLRTSWVDEAETHYMRPALIAKKFGFVADRSGGEPTSLRRRIAARSNGFVARVRSRSVRKYTLHRLARTRRVTTRFGRAWVLMDRIHDANDSAEVLFKHLRSERRDINAWFVLEADTPDWDRLVGEGYRQRMIAHGSIKWHLLMLHCDTLLSSHIDVPVHAPPAILALRRPTWNFVFLQHGVIKDDLSNWLNRKRLALFITSTPAEYESIAGDFSPYVFTSKEVALTGLPRFDALISARRRRGDRRPDTLVLAPTWRYWLNKPLAVGVQRREVIPEFRESEFSISWRALIDDPELDRLAESHELRKVLLPHPNLVSAVAQWDLDASWTIGHYTDASLHDLFARAAVLVTDYSSMAFNAAYLHGPVVYFQFDRDRVLSGGHIGRRGYFDYERDGFGPVCADVEEVIGSMAKMLVDGTPPSPYRERLDETFPFRDGQCSSRVVAAVEQLGRTSKT